MFCPWFFLPVPPLFPYYAFVFFFLFFFSKYDSHNCMLSLISHLNNFLYTFMLQFFKLSSPAKETFRLWVFVILFSLLYPFILFFLSFPLLLYENICLYNDSNMLYESNINSAINFFLQIILHVYARNFNQYNIKGRSNQIYSSTFQPRKLIPHKIIIYYNQIQQNMGILAQSN